MDNIGSPVTTLLLRRIWRTLSVRFNKRQLDSVESLVEFLQTRAAYVAQTALYGYLKTRIGIQYPTVFQNDAFAGSINIAKWRTYIACLSDLTVFATALCVRQGNHDQQQSIAMAQSLFGLAIKDTVPEEASGILAEDLASRFAARAGAIDWRAAAIGEAAFNESPAALIESAPIAEELKQYDQEIVTNSIRFRWRDIRDQLRKRLDGPAVCRDWRNSQGVTGN